MSIHKLSAGSGYDYLTRQVAAMDATHKGRVGLAPHYTECGEIPGVWVGSGMAGINGPDAGDMVAAEQMRLLFGEGRHPLAGVGAPWGLALGLPFPTDTNAPILFQREVGVRFAAANITAGRPADSPIAADQRARIRTEVARESFRAEQGRDPADARELSGALARLSRPQPAAVAGYDLTFSPVKSVSTL